MRIRIFQPIVPEYRVALFNGVGRKYGDAVEVWAAEGEGQDKSYPLAEMRYDYEHPFKKLGPFRWQCGLSIEGLARGDVIVICGDIHQLSSLWIAFKAKCCGISVVWWGHHISSTSGRFGIKMRLFFTKWLSDVVLCYTQVGVDWFRARGWKTPVFATGNTIDMLAVQRAIAAWNDGDHLRQFQKENGLENREVVLICGVLRWKMRVDQLLRALASPAIARRGTRLVVVGDGEGRIAWEALAKDLKIEDRVIWTGALRDQMDIAPWFLSARAFVYPGIIGLSIIHAFSYGLPVVCHGNGLHHGPEFSAHEDGRTGYTFKENDEADFAAKIIRILDDEPVRQEISEHVKKLAYERYGIQTMIDNYCAAIEVARKV